MEQDFWKAFVILKMSYETIDSEIYFKFFKWVTKWLVL